METRRSLRIRGGNPPKEGPKGGNKGIAKEDPKTKGGGKAKGDVKKGAGGGQAKEEKGKKTSQSDKSKKDLKRHTGGRRSQGEVEEATEEDSSNGTNESEELPKRGSKTGKDASNRVEATKGKTTHGKVTQGKGTHGKGTHGKATQGKATQRKKSLEEAKPITTADAESECTNETSVNSRRSERNVKKGGMILRKQSSSMSKNDGGSCSTARSNKGREVKRGTSGSGTKGVKEEDKGDHSLRRGKSKEGPKQKDSVKKEDQGRGGDKSGKGGNTTKGKAAGEVVQRGGVTSKKGSRGGGSPSKSSSDLGSSVDQRRSATQDKKAKGTTTPPIKGKMKGNATVSKATGKMSNTVVDAHTVSSTSVNNPPQEKGKSKGSRKEGAEDEPIPASHHIKNMDSEEVQSSRAKCSSNRSSTVEWNEQVDAAAPPIGATNEGVSNAPMNRSIKRRLSQIIDVMKKKQVFQLIGDQDERDRIQFIGHESEGGDAIKGEVPIQKEKETTGGAKGEKNNNLPFLQRVNLDVIYNKLHYDFYKGEEDFHRDVLVIFQRIKLAIEMEKNPKEKQNLYQLRCNAWKTYEGEFYKLLLSMRGTKEAKKFSTTQKELREQEEKYLAQLLLESSKVELEEAKAKQGKTLPKSKGSGHAAEQPLEGKQFEGKKLEEKQLEEARPTGGTTNHDQDHTQKKPSSSSISVPTSNLPRGSHTPFRVRLRLGSFNLDEDVTVRKGKEDNRSGGITLKVNEMSCASSPEKGGTAVETGVTAVDPQTEEWRRLIRVHVLQSLTRDSSTAFYFTTPVLEDENLSEQIKNEYRKKIEKPMDYTTVSRNLTQGVYQNPWEFYKDLKLIFQNCFAFNPDIVQNQYIIEAAKRGQERSSNLWGKWKGKIVEAYEQGGHLVKEAPTTVTTVTTVNTVTMSAMSATPTVSTVPLNLPSYVEFFKGLTRKKKKFSCIYAMWVEYLLANRVSFEELCSVRGIKWEVLNEKCQTKISNPGEVNLHRFKKMNNQSLPFYVFREEYQTALRESREEVRRVKKQTELDHLDGVKNLYEVNHLYDEVGGESAPTDNPEYANLQFLLDQGMYNQMEEWRPREEQPTEEPTEEQPTKEPPKEPALKPFRSRKRRIHDTIFFDENVFDSYLEGKRSCMVKCSRNVFLADCFYYSSVEQSLGDFMADGEEGTFPKGEVNNPKGEVNNPKGEVGMTGMEGVKTREEKSSGLNEKEEGIEGSQSAEAATPKGDKIVFRVRAVNEEKPVQRAVCKGFEESPEGEDETDISWGAYHDGAHHDGAGVHEGSVVEATGKINERTGVGLTEERLTEERPSEEPDDAPPIERISQLANNVTEHPQRRKEKKKKGERLQRAVMKNQLGRKTLVMNLKMKYCPLEDSSFFQVKEGHVYRHRVDVGFSFVLRSRRKLDVAIKVDRRNVSLFEEGCLDFLSIQIMNKCKRTNHVEFYLCNRMAGTGRSLVQLLSGYFARLDSPEGELSNILPRVRLYIRDVDVLMRLEKDDVTHLTTIAILKRTVL
ncbi:Uncharacterized protein PCOAH_00003710 [Plasmodium coatneyi]|uniref:Bromo domain-containing protein n=1 Tax=Plasmodium coatneyi TaxID=208452 RepID=A0A1B1DT34_9APIC|nr:Uncharacterized protein PCOAH_00003710 [Plasmodium coatneyi]ANQ05966.1 Uncharacterized protein PCOAH_00003710 [Plasmodium coatneyi]